MLIDEPSVEDEGLSADQIAENIGSDLTSMEGYTVALIIAFY